MHSVRVYLASVLLMLAAGSAQAVSITWTFQNAIFDDATALTGSFDFDMAGNIFSTDAYSNVNLSTQNGAIGGQNYNSVNFISGSFGFTSTAGSFFSPQLLGVAFKDALSNAIGSIDIAGGMESANIGSLFRPNIVTRELVSGAVVSDAGGRTVQLAEPAALAVFILGLFTVIGLRRRAII